MDLPVRPVLRVDLSARLEDDANVLLVSRDRHHRLSGHVYPLLLPLLNGERSVDTIMAELTPRFAPAVIYYSLGVLADRGFLRERSDGTGRSVQAAWDAYGVHPDRAEARLRDTVLRVRSVGGSVPPGVGAALGRWGLRTGDSGTTDLVFANDYQAPGLDEVNRAALAEGRPWILSRFEGGALWLGPLFVPNSTACWECLRLRLAQTRPLDAFLQEEGHPVGPWAGAQPAASMMRSTVGFLAAVLRTSIGAGQLDGVRDTLIQYDVLDHTSTRHPVVRWPQCSHCGDPAAYTRRAESPIVLSPTEKSGGGRGGYRSADPATTLERFSAHLDPLTGVVESLDLLTMASPGVRAYASGPNRALRQDKPWLVGPAAASVSLGKGTTDRQARLSALGEAIELYSATFQGDEPRRRGTLAEVDGIDPNTCMRFSSLQYADRDERNTSASVLDRVPPPFDPELPMEWTPLWSLTEGRQKYLPTMLLYHGYPASAVERCCVSDTNGVAAGSSFEDAVLHALFEVIERDCVAIWWHNRLQRPGVVLEDVDEPFVRQALVDYEAMGREWWALDVTNDLEVPCFVAVTRKLGSSEEILFGMGAHLDARVALERAVAEMNQTVAVCDNTGDLTHYGARLGAWLSDATVEARPFLRPARESATRLAAFPRFDHPDLRADIEWCRTRLEGMGLEVLVLDQTRPEVGIPVARVVVPGLRHFRSRLGSGRLYDVPVRQGWLESPTAEDRLNPTPFIL